MPVAARWSCQFLWLSFAALERAEGMGWLGSGASCIRSAVAGRSLADAFALVVERVVAVGCFGSDVADCLGSVAVERAADQDWLVPSPLRAVCADLA